MNPFFNKKEKLIFVADKEDPSKGANHQKVLTLKQGDIFGELALMRNNNKRAATITCMSDCHFAVLDRRHFQVIQQQHEFMID